MRLRQNKECTGKYGGRIDKWINRWVNESSIIKFFVRCYHVLKKITDCIEKSVDVYSK